jgi:hypothetical protein
LQGRLAYLLTEGVTPNPRWLVTFDEQPHKDEELYEKAFGKLLKAANEEVEKPMGGSAPTRRIRPALSTTPVPSPSNSKKTSRNSGSSEEGADPSPEKIKNKAVVFSDGGSPPHSDDSSAAHDRKVSTREQRSRRRQAKIDVDPVTSIELSQGAGLEQLPPSTTIIKKRQRPPPVNCKNTKRTKTDDSQEVVKVNLLTGTLYLYRGLNRRAEFVRRI